MSTLLIPILIPLIAIAVSIYFIFWLFKKDQGTEKMQAIAQAIREGASAFLKRQYKTIAFIGLIIAAGLWLAYVLAGKPTTGWQTAMALKGCIKGAPPDSAENHDKYLYGGPEE